MNAELELSRFQDRKQLTSPVAWVRILVNFFKTRFVPEKVSIHRIINVLKLIDKYLIVIEEQAVSIQEV